MTRLPILLMLLTAGSASLQGGADPVVVRVQNVRPSDVDGVLDDWPAGFYSTPLLEAGRDSASSAVLQLSASSQALRLGVFVKDPEPLFTIQLFHEYWRNDSIEIHFFVPQSAVETPMSGIESGLIRVSAEKSGLTNIEGTVSVKTRGGHTRATGYPQMWELLGTQAVLLRVPGGYSAEVEIPRSLLGLYKPGDRLKINVRVCDNVNGEPCARVLSWSKEAYDASVDSDEFYQTITINGPMAGTEEKAQGSVASSLARALAAVDKYDPGTAVAAVAPIADHRRWPMLASMQIAARQAMDAVKTLERITTSGTSESLRLWAVQLLGVAYSRLQMVEQAKQQFRLLMASDAVAFRDAGTEALMQTLIESGDADQVIALYRSFAEAGNYGSGRTIQAAATWLRSQKRFDEAAEAFGRLSRSNSLHSQERSGVLMNLQSLHFECGDLDKAWSVGMRLQSSASPNSGAAADGLAEMVRIGQARQQSNPDDPALSTQLVSVLQEKIQGFGPNRLMALAKVFAEEHRLDRAAEIYSKVSDGLEFHKNWRAKALAGLQRVQHEQKRDAESSETGLRLQIAFPDELTARGESAMLLRETCAAQDSSIGLKSRCGAAVQKLLADLTRRAAGAEGSEAGLARSLLHQLSR